MNRFALLTTSLVFLLIGSAHADVVMPSSAYLGPAPGTLGTGLSGVYDYLGTYASTQNLTTLALIQGALPLTPTATFNATLLNYIGGDKTPVEAWLGSDGASVQPQPNAGSNGIYTSYFDFSGFFNVTTPTVTFTIGSDDGAALYIGGALVASTDGVHMLQTSTVSVDFSQPGLYAIDLQYFNRSTQDGTGGAQLQFSGASSSNLYAQPSGAATPEPASAVLFGASALFLAMARRKLSLRK
jgi:hypothetical protein